MRHPENIENLTALPVDWMGLIFYEKSKRYVPDSEAAAILEASGDEVARVGVFVNEMIPVIVQKVHQFKLDYVQLHGHETPDYCYDLLAASARRFGCDDTLQVIKAFAVDETFDFSTTMDYAPYVNYFLFDTKGAHPGGNGVAFDWSILKKYTGQLPFLLSGGLRPDSLVALRDFSHPQWAGIDLNSGFELAPAQKDVATLRDFLEVWRGSAV